MTPRTCLTWYTFAWLPRGWRLRISATPSRVNMWSSPRTRSAKPKWASRARRSSNRMFASELSRRIPSKVFETLLTEEPPALKASSGTPNDSVEQAESTSTRSDRPEVADLQDQERGRSDLDHGVLGPDTNSIMSSLTAAGR